ncbi:unnamed protein product [Cochlearia groenlandica]
MATTSSTTKAKPDKQNLTRNKSINRKPKPPSSVSSEDGSDQKPPEKPLPNYLKPTISSRPDPVKLSKKNNNNNTLDDNQKLLRRRSFDRPSSSLTSPPSTSSTRNQKSLKVSPSLPRDKTVVPKEKPVTAQRSSSFHGSRGVPRGGTSSKSPLVAPKKSGLSSTSSSSTSLKSKKEVSEDVLAKKVSEKEIPLDIASLSSSARDDEEEVLKVESALKLEDDIGKTKEDKEVQVDVVQADESVEENESGEQTMAASSVIVDCISVNREEDEELIKEDKTKEEIDETKEQDNNKEDNVEVNEEAKKEIDEDEAPKKVDIDMKEVESIKETTKEEEVKEEEKKKVKEEEKEKVKKEEKEKVKEEEKEKVKEEEKEKVKEEDGTREVIKKKEVVKGKKESSPSAYNDVIASKIQENPRKNKVLALAGAFQTVIDYETAASK